MELLYERGSNALPQLNQVDAMFKVLKRLEPSKVRPVVNKLEKLLSKLFGTTVIIELQNHGDLTDNFAVLPILKDKPEENRLTAKSITLNDIDVLYFMIGIDLIKQSKPRQITAILLHEIGHVVEHVTRMNALFDSVLHRIKYISDILSRVPIINFIFGPLFIITTRSLNFRNHQYEHNADQFAVKYGYGDDLAQWCLTDVNASKQKVPFNFTGIAYRLKRIFEGSDHPSFKKRIAVIAKEMKKSYGKEYGNKKIETLLDKYYKL